MLTVAGERPKGGSHGGNPKHRDSEGNSVKMFGMAPRSELEIPSLLQGHKGCYVLYMGKEADLEFEVVDGQKQTVVEPLANVEIGADLVPTVVSRLGKDAARSYLSFFVDHIRNRNTRDAYFRSANRFFDWCERRRLSLGDVQSFHVSGYVEELGQSLAIASVKQNLAALRMLFDWLMIRQVCAENPCHAVRGPKLKVTTGKTPALDEADAKLLLNSISGTDVTSLRDRALIGLMIYSFARISAALSMDVKDYASRGQRRMWIQLKEKRGRQHAMPCHHKLEEYLDAYLQTAGIEDQKNGPLFRSAKGRTGVLTERRLRRGNAYDAIRRRARQAGLATEICPHTFRATGITNYLINSGTLEIAQQMAAHADARTTKLYDRRNEQVSLDEIERITI